MSSVDLNRISTSTAGLDNRGGFNLFTAGRPTWGGEGEGVTAVGMPTLSRFVDVDPNKRLGSLRIKKAEEGIGKQLKGENSPFAGDGSRQLGGYLNLSQYRSEEHDFLAHCIVNNIQYAREVACQPEPVLNGHLYLSFFGDKPMSYIVSGVAFDYSPCHRGSPGGIGGGENELVNPVHSLVEFYEMYKLKELREAGKNQRAREQITLTTYDTLWGGSITYVGVLIRMNLVTSTTTQGVRQHDFTYTFISIR